MRKSLIHKIFLVVVVQAVVAAGPGLHAVGGGGCAGDAAGARLVWTGLGTAAAAVEAIEPMIDRLVKANFQGDYLGAGAALRELVEFERAAGIEPSGKLAVVQVAETQAFADGLDAKIKGYVDAGQPILAAMELNNYKDILRFEPAGAARARTAATTVDVAGQALCAKLTTEAGGVGRAAVLAAGVCAAFGMGQGAGAAAKDSGAGRMSPVAAPVSGMTATGTVKGFLGATDLQGALRRAAGEMGLLADGAELALSCQVDGTSVLTKSSIPGTLNFEYGVEIPYSEMREVCDWKEVVTTQIVEKVDGGRKKVTEKTEVCMKTQRPVDLVRVEKKTRPVAGTQWKRTAIWQVRARFDDGDGCAGQKSFDGQRVDNDFEHAESDPGIGLNPHKPEFPAEGAIADDVARQITTWLIGAEADCLKAKWCDFGAGQADLEKVLRCAGIPGADSGRIDQAIIARFGVTLKELLNFIGQYGRLVRADYIRPEADRPVLKALEKGPMMTTFERYQSHLLRSEPAAPGDGINVTWMGNAGVYVSDGETGFLIDPFVSRWGMFRVAMGLPLRQRNEVIAEWIRLLGARDVKAVLVSHSHYDHALDAPIFAAALRVPIVGTESTANIGRGAGLPEELIKVVRDRDQIEIGRFRISFLASEHGPALFERVPYPGLVERPLKPPAGVGRYRMGGVFGIYIEHPAGTLVHHGSAGNRPGMYQGLHADVVMLGLAGRAETEPYLAAVVDALGATTVIPIHYDNMFQPVRPVFDFIPGVRFDEFLDTCAATRPNLRVATLPIGIQVGVL